MKTVVLCQNYFSMKNVFTKLFAKSILVATIGLSLSSCSNFYYYQVYDVSSDNLKEQGNSLVYENEDCKVLYNLWSYNGELKFAFFNKTDRDIFINMGQSFYVENGRAVDYYQARTYTSQSYDQYSYSVSHVTASAQDNAFWGNNIYNENAKAIVDAAKSKGVSAQLRGVTKEEKEFVCIPANCFKVFNYFKVNPSRMIACVQTTDYPKTSCLVENYTQASSPMSFGNRIAYGFTKSDIAEKHINNNFWISSITNYSQKEAIENSKEETNCYNLKVTRKKVFRIGGPDKFYKLYVNTLN